MDRFLSIRPVNQNSDPRHRDDARHGDGVRDHDDRGVHARDGAPHGGEYGAASLFPLDRHAHELTRRSLEQRGRW